MGWAKACAYEAQDSDNTRGVEKVIWVTFFCGSREAAFDVVDLI